jgi:hypothetical protein
MERAILVISCCVNPSLLQPLREAGAYQVGASMCRLPGLLPTAICRRSGGQESYMTSTHVSPPSMEQLPFDVGVLRTGILALVALIVGSMFTYDLVRSSLRTPLPRPRPSALGAAPVLVADPVAEMPSNYETGATQYRRVACARGLCGS